MPTSSRAPKAVLGAAALLVAGLALTGCGSSGGGGKTSSDSTLTPAPSASDSATASTAPSGSPSSLPPGAESKPVTCGTFQMKGNQESVVRIKGTAACSSLMAIIGDYNKAAKSSGGAATVKGWKCRTASPAETRKHGYITLCTKGPDEFATKIHH